MGVAGPKGARRTAQILMVVAIVFWLWFGVGSAVVERGGAANWVLHLLLPAGIFVLSTLLAWRWEAVGGALLAVEGLAATGFVLWALVVGRISASGSVLMSLTLGLPPLAAGILFLYHRRLARRAWREEERP